MYRINETSGALVGVWTDGRLTAQDLERLAVDLEKRIARYGQLRLLFRARYVCGWDATAFSNVERFSQRLNACIERVAIVGEQDGGRYPRGLAHRMAGADAHHFLSHELGQAWAWLQSDTQIERG